MIIIALVLLLTGEHKVFYLQERVGRYGKKFKIIKFVTMVSNSPNLGTGTVTLKNDPRVLPVGRFLRKTKLNELPQLLNVLKGDMSLIGWRAQTEDIFQYFTPEVRESLVKIRPGLSGIGPVVFRDEESLLDPTKVPDPRRFYLEVLTPYKGYIEKWYVDNYSVRNYLLLILLTVWVVLFPKSELPRRVFKGLPEEPEVIKRLRK